MYTILKSLYDKSLAIDNDNFNKIKIIISNFISIDLLEKIY